MNSKLIAKIEDIATSRLVLEVRREVHAAEVYEACCDESLYTYISMNIPESLDWLANSMKTLERQTSPDGSELWFGWVGKDMLSKKPVGIFGITIVGEEAFVSYIVFQEFWGCGMAVEACDAIIKYIKIAFNPKRFVIEMDTRNRSSVKVAEKLGFEFVKVTDNAAMIKGKVSHEFQFQKF